MPPSFLRSASYQEIATEIAARLAAGRAGADPLAPWAEEVVVASGGLANSIARELLARIPNGIAGLELQTLESLARRIVNAAGEFPRVANDAERRLAMRTAVRRVDDAMLESRGIAAMLERSYRDVRDSGFTLRAFERRVRSVERSLRNPRRTRTILEVWFEYERLISRLGAIDPADLARARCRAAETETADRRRLLRHDRRAEKTDRGTRITEAIHPDRGATGAPACRRRIRNETRRARSGLR